MAPTLPTMTYSEWQPTCDTLHAHTQVLGKIAAEVAAPEPQLQHAALRLTARGWETAPLPCPNGAGAFVVALDLQRHEAVVETSRGASRAVPLGPDRPVGKVTAAVLAATAELAGAVTIDPTPQEVAWTAPLDTDTEHASYDPDQVAAYFAMATEVGLIFAAFRAPFRGRSTPVNAWWGSFDLAVNLFSGSPAAPPSEDFIMRNAMDSQEFALGWWPGDRRYDKPAFYAYAHPAPDDFSGADLGPSQARWDGELGEYVLDWDDVIAAPDPRALALEFGHAAFEHACTVCDWDPELAATAAGNPPPVT